MPAMDSREPVANGCVCHIAEVPFVMGADTY